MIARILPLNCSFLITLFIIVIENAPYAFALVANIALKLSQLSLSTINNISRMNKF